MGIISFWQPSERGEVNLCVLGALTGLVAHQSLFIKGEWHVQAPSLLVIHLGLYTLVPLLAYLSQGSETGKLLSAIVWMSYGYLPALMASIGLYRYFFHPLTRNNFGGPWYARLTKLWHVWACFASKRQNQRVLAPLHETYGDFVRTGPAEVTVFHPDVFTAVDGPRSECLKSEWYDLLHPSMALVTARNKPTHAARRREWNDGFTTKALRDHEAKILPYVDQLDERVKADAAAGQVTNVRNLFFWFGFDIMGEFVFSRPFNMLEDGKWHYVIIKLQSALSLLGYFSPAPWVIQIGFNLAPRVSILKDWFDMTAWCEKTMHSRLERAGPGETPDLTHYLMEKGKSQTAPRSSDSLAWLSGDSLLAIVAGSEPTAVVMMGVISELAKHPDQEEMVFQEVADVDPTDLKTLMRLPHLNAVLNETLRLYPALMTGGNRKTTQSGLTVGGRYIPPNTTIVAPRYTIHRREDCFEQPWDFIPERWTTRPEMIRNIAAYAPFGTGHHSCLGRTLATNILRYVVARLVQKYHFRLPPGDDGSSLTTFMRDQFTSNPGPLDIFFEPRIVNDGAR